MVQVADGEGHPAAQAIGGISDVERRHVAKLELSDRIGRPAVRVGETVQRWDESRDADAWHGSLRSTRSGSTVASRCLSAVSDGHEQAARGTNREVRQAGLASRDAS